MLVNRLVTVERHTAGTFLAGLELYRQRLDKGYSLTDCISIQTMRREGLTEALTNDRHFEQEGFRALFRVQRSSIYRDESLRASWVSRRWS